MTDTRSARADAFMIALPIFGRQRDASTDSVSMPRLMSTITLRVRFAAVAGARLRLAALLMRLAAAVGGCDLDISVGSKPAA